MFDGSGWWVIFPIIGLIFIVLNDVEDVWLPASRFWERKGDGSDGHDGHDGRAPRAGQQTG